MTVKKAKTKANTTIKPKVLPIWFVIAGSTYSFHFQKQKPRRKEHIWEWPTYLYCENLITPIMGNITKKKHHPIQICCQLVRTRQRYKPIWITRDENNPEVYVCHRIKPRRVLKNVYREMGVTRTIKQHHVHEYLGFTMTPLESCVKVYIKIRKVKS